MRPIPVSDLPQHIIDQMSPEDRADNGLKSTAEWEESGAKKTKQREDKAEREIQTQVEAYLTHLGYERRTPENIGRGMPRSGWFVHLHEAKRNPILLDILVLANSTPRQYLELELKTATGKLRVEQEALVAQGASIARTVEDACRICKVWHDGLGGVR